MKIVDKRKENKKTFGDIGYGDIFEYSKEVGCIFVKLPEVCCHDKVFNAFDLTFKRYYMFDNEDVIITPKSSLVIE